MMCVFVEFGWSMHGLQFGEIGWHMHGLQFGLVSLVYACSAIRLSLVSLCIVRNLCEGCWCMHGVQLG